MLLDIALIILIVVILCGVWIFYDLYKRAKKRYWDLHQQLLDMQQQVAQVQQQVLQVQKILGHYPKESKINGPVIVYQMGRVGSRSVYEALVNLNVGVPIYHCHVLHNLDRMADGVKKQMGNPVNTLGVIEEGKKIRKFIDEDLKKGWNLISLSRDPIAQSLSSFFRSVEFEEIIPNARHKIGNGSICVDDLLNIFLEKWPRHRDPLIWFDLQFKPVFDIDVYSRPFPWEKGYDIFKNGRFSLLLIRLEDLDSCAGQAFKEFLGMPDFKLKKSNEATNKWYKEIYKEFISKIVLPEKYLNEIYDSKFSRHFYSPEELDAFRAKWTQGSQ